jgi:hypothetical protein
MKSKSGIFDPSSHLSTERLLNYLRHHDSKEERYETERHLTDCEMCSDALEGLRMLDQQSSMMRISADLHRMAAKRKIRHRKIFSQLELVTLFAVIFLILFLVAIAVFMFRK